MTAHIVSDGPQSKWLKVHVKGNATAVANSLGSIANPEGVRLHIHEGYLKIITAAAGAAHLDVGMSDFALNGLAANAIYYVVSNNSASQAAATTPQGLAWAADTFLNFYNHVAVASTAFEAYLYLRYIRVGDDVSRV
jgi:hypothetical protein